MNNKVKNLYARCRCVFISLISHFRAGKTKKGQEKYILLPLFGMIGDAVIFLDALKGYQELFPLKKGYHIVVACRPQVKAMLEELRLTKNIEVEELDRGKMYEDAAVFSDAVKRFSRHYYELIINVRARYALEDVFIYALPAKCKVVFRNDDTKPASLIARFFFSNTYDQTFYAEQESEQYKRYGKMLRNLGLQNYQSHVSRIPRVKDENLHAHPYCLICPSSSAKGKCWAETRFAEIADFIIDKYDLDICMTGSNADKEYSEAVMQQMKFRERAFDFSGTTSMNGWVELIREAVFVVSNDSASIHLAAAVQTPSICIAPQHDGYRFLPYQPDIVLQDDRLPIVVRGEKVRCFDCQKSNLKSKAQADQICRQSIKENGMFQCINAVSVEMVQNAIIKLMKEL